MFSAEQFLTLHHQREAELFARADEARRARAAYAASASRAASARSAAGAATFASPLPVRMAQEIRTMVYGATALLGAGRTRARRTAGHAGPDACAC